MIESSYAARLASIPIDHIIAEVIAFPLSSEASLQQATIEFDPQLGKGTGELWRAAERTIIPSVPSFSLDEFVAIRDSTWFEDQPQNVRPLHDYLKAVARQYLSVRGSTAVPCLKPGTPYLTPSSSGGVAEARARQFWRWFTFALPPDLMLAALWELGSGPTRVNLDCPQLSRKLTDRGYAETHMHIKAAWEFPVLWAGLMCALTDHTITPQHFESPGAVLQKDQALGKWLIRAALGRYTLASFLHWHTAVSASRSATLTDFLNDVAWPRIYRHMGATSEAVWRTVLRELAFGRFEPAGPAYGNIRHVYARATGIHATGCPKNFNNIQYADPLARFFPSNSLWEPNPEMGFAAAGLEYLRQQWRTDTAFAKIFWQTMRIRAIFYRHVIQRPMTPGLQWFIRTYGRMKPARKHLDSTSIMLQSAAHVCGHPHGLRSLEVRTSPDDNLSELNKLLSQGWEWWKSLHYTGSDTIEFGFVLHLSKLRGGGAEKGVPKANWRNSHADPRPMDRRVNSSGYRYAAFYIQKRNEAITLARALLARPLALAIVRGIDICTDELGVPTWVMAPLFRYLRDVGHCVSRYLRVEFDCDVPPFHTTVHVGEDFVHLLGGLRRIDEAIRFLGLGEGDRLGHGVALGIDAAKWAQSAGRIPVMREERLLDLLWEWRCYSQQGVPVNRNRMALIEREVSRLSQLIFRESWSPFHFDEFLVQPLHHEAALREAGFPNGPLLWTGPASQQPLLYYFLSDADVFEEGRKIEWIDPASEAETLESLQNALRQKVGHLGLAVEINPSSNLLIGNLGDLRHHPLWRLSPPRNNGTTPPISVCIGSDDPLTFATCLRQEYTLLHDTLVLGGLSYNEANAWIERARITGLESRFTIPWNSACWDSKTHLSTYLPTPRLDYTISSIL